VRAAAILAAVAGVAIGCASAREPTKPVPEAGTGELRVRLHGVSEGEGSLVCALFEDEASFDGDRGPLRSAVVPATGESVEWTLELPFGAYAVKVYQDLDGDGELDRGPLRAPTEPYGISNDARGTFGPPPWEKARFEVDQPAVSLDISIE